MTPETLRDLEGRVQPGGGGSAVAPEFPWNLPPHRRPKRLGRASTGPTGDLVYAIRLAALEVLRLKVRTDAPDHAFVEPLGRFLSPTARRQPFHLVAQAVK